MKTNRPTLRRTRLGLAITAVTFTLSIAGSILPASTRAADPVADLRVEAKRVLGVLPEKMPGAETDTPAMVALGRRLFSDPILSVNKSQSCNSCHRIDGGRGGVDNEPTSPGAFGKRGGRNSPTVLNAGFHMAQFWDGRAPNLMEQAKGPVLNPVEMSMPSEQEVVKRLSEDAAYSRLFAKAFPDDTTAVNYGNMARAIAAFERTLRTHDRFDDFLKGDDKALDAAEQRGLKSFLTVGCTTCHSGPLLGGNAYQKVGLIHPYATTDEGRFEVTKDEDDKRRFKVPSLRNIAITWPYFHNGKVTALDDAVKTMAHIQLDRKLTDDETRDLVAFLKALTDKPRAKAVK